MLPKLDAEQERRRRVFAELHNILIILSVEVAIIVYLISGCICRGFTIEWLVSVMAFNYVVVALLTNGKWFIRRLRSNK